MDNLVDPRSNLTFRGQRHIYESHDYWYFKYFFDQEGRVRRILCHILFWVQTLMKFNLYQKVRPALRAISLTALAFRQVFFFPLGQKKSFLVISSNLGSLGEGGHSEIHSASWYDTTGRDAERVDFFVVITAFPAVPSFCNSYPCQRCLVAILKYMKSVWGLEFCKRNINPINDRHNHFCQWTMHIE